MHEIELGEAVNEVSDRFNKVAEQLKQVTEIVQMQMTPADRKHMNEFLDATFGDWQAAVQGSLEEVSYVFAEAALIVKNKKRAQDRRSLMNCGVTMSNGAVVIDYHFDGLDSTSNGTPGGIVLAVADWSPDPYVTWTFQVEGDSIECYNGHYFDTIEAAMADFKKRAKL